MAENVKYDIFVSHNRQQKDWVRIFVRQLRGLGLSVFFDEDSIKPGQDIVRQGRPGRCHFVESKSITH